MVRRLTRVVKIGIFDALDFKSLENMIMENAMLAKPAQFWTSFES